jgi:hypothetical protein
VRRQPCGDEDAPWTYSVTADPQRWLAGLPVGPLLLHVDFDYFCNRFDGDSDWEGRPTRNPADRAEVLRRIDALAEAIAGAAIAPRIASVCGALSPGFFPAEFWGESVERLARGLSRAGVDVTAWSD